MEEQPWGVGFLFLDHTNGPLEKWLNIFVEGLRKILH